MTPTHTQQTLKVDCLKQLYEYIHWMEHWGRPHSPREEKKYYDILVKIDDEKLDLPQFLSSLRTHLNTFLLEFDLEPFINTPIGETFIDQGKGMLQALESYSAEFPDERAIVEESKHIITEALKEVQSILKEAH